MAKQTTISSATRLHFIKVSTQAAERDERGGIKRWVEPRAFAFIPPMAAVAVPVSTFTRAVVELHHIDRSIREPGSVGIEAGDHVAVRVTSTGGKVASTAAASVRQNSAHSATLDNGTRIIVEAQAS